MGDFLLLERYGTSLLEGNNHPIRKSNIDTIKHIRRRGRTGFILRQGLSV